MITASLHVCQIILDTSDISAYEAVVLYNFVPESTVLHQPSLGSHQPNNHAWCSFPQMVILWESPLSIPPSDHSPRHPWTWLVQQVWDNSFNTWLISSQGQEAHHSHAGKHQHYTAKSFSTNVTKYSVRADSEFAPSQWETAFNAVSLYLGASLDRISSAVCTYHRLGNNKYLIASDLQDPLDQRIPGRLKWKRGDH